MLYRVLKPFKYLDVHGVEHAAKPNTLVDIVTRRDQIRLQQQFKIGPVDLPAVIGGVSVKPASTTAAIQRLGLFLITSAHYSGGRVHLYQYASVCKQLGMEVFYISNTEPIWARDYKEHFAFINWQHHRPPDDLDLIVTDGKGVAAVKAREYKKTHPHVPLIVMNFETPNWMADFMPSLAKHMSLNKGCFQMADLLLANSRESAKYLRKWVEKDIPIKIIPPAVNTDSLKRKPNESLAMPRRPFAVWSARGQDYKGRREAIDAIFTLKRSFDLVCFGQSDTRVPHNAKHQIIPLTGFSDAAKFAMMRAAQIVLAPSRFEGFGMVPAEAIACDTPVVAYDLPVLRQEYKGVEGLHLVKWGDRKAFVRKVHELLKKPKDVVDSEKVIENLGLPAMKKRVSQLPYHIMRPRKKVSAQLIAYWGFLPEAVEAVYPYVHEILIAFGPDKNAVKIDDGSLERIQALKDPDKKIKLEVREQWNDKRNMRQWCYDHSTGNYCMVLDGDEIWAGFEHWMDDPPGYGCPRWVTLWHDGKHQVIGLPSWGTGRWGKEIKPYGCVCQHYRWSWLRHSYEWTYHCRLQAKTKNPVRIKPGAIEEKYPKTIIYHLGHVLPAKVMRAKHRFYIDRDGKDPGRVRREKAWHNWKGKLGDCGDGIIKKVTWKLPAIVQRALRSAKQIKVR